MRDEIKEAAKTANEQPAEDFTAEQRQIVDQRFQEQFDKEIAQKYE